jgi:hypothetical protein
MELDEEIIIYSPSNFLFMKARLSILLPAGLLLAANVVAQSVFIPGGTGGIGFSANSGIGVFNNTPINGFFDVMGDVRLNGTPGAGDGVFFSSPGGEKGLSIGRLGFTGRADMRFDGTNVRLLCGPGGGPPGTSNGITVAPNGSVGVGEPSPLASYRMHILGSPTHTIGANADMLLGVGGTVTGFRANVQNNTVNKGFEGTTAGGTSTYGGHFSGQNATTDNTGVFGTARGGQISTGGGFNASNAQRVYGVGGGATGTNAPGSTATGGQFSANTAQSIVGVEAIANGSLGNTFAYAINAVAFANAGTLFNHGVKSSVSAHAGATQSSGVYTIATSGEGTINYGVYSMIHGGVPHPVPANGSGRYAGYFWDNTTGSTNASGAAFFNGTMLASAPGVTAISDRKFKENVNGMDGMLSKIMQLNPATYTFKSKSEFPSFNFPEGTQFGFVAQELEKVFPELVKESLNPAQYNEEGKKIADAVTFKGVKYTEMIPVLVAGMQEQQAQIEAKDAKIAELEERLARLEANKPSGVGTSNTLTGAVLYQNTPNPFDSYTDIRYVLPRNYTAAKVLVFDMNGRQLRDIALQGTGEGSVQLSSGELAAGMYLYSLIIDGKEIDTKRMILSE